MPDAMGEISDSLCLRWCNTLQYTCSVIKHVGVGQNRGSLLNTKVAD